LDDRSFNSHLELKKDVTKCSDQCSSNDVDQLLSSLGLEGLVKSKDQINTNASNIRNSSVSENEHDKEFLFEIAIKKFSNLFLIQIEREFILYFLNL
jgi:hypothetical protein